MKDFVGVRKILTLPTLQYFHGIPQDTNDNPLDWRE